MPRIQVNLDDVESAFEVYPDGDYFVEIKNSKIKQGANSPYIVWIAEILEGEFEGKMISWQTSLAENALWNLKNLLETIGLAWDEDGFDTEEAHGGKLIVTNQVRAYEGVDRNNIVGYTKVG